MKRLCSIVLCVLAFATFSLGQVKFSDDQIRVFDGKGNPSSIEQIVKALAENEVVFLGELHDDAVGHAVQMEIFQRAVAQYAANRKMALSLEMFERDVQIILNEYLSGLISEAQFVASSRPWANYKTDYRPLVELAKEKRLPVIAANAPRRYVNMVSRNGRESLNALTKDAKKWIAPLPYGEPSETYAKKFKALMGPSPEAQMGIDKILASQSLWDATMSNSVYKFLKDNKKPLVIHLNGGFHTESRLGTVEHLLKYRSKTKVLVVTMRYEDDFKTFDKSKHTDIGDFVILTAPKPKAVGVLSQILRRMDLHNQALKTLRAELRTTRHDPQLKTVDTFTGMVSYLPKTGGIPMAVRVDRTNPEGEQLVVIGENYQLYRSRLNMVIDGKTVRTPTGVYTPLRFMTMSGREFKDNYNVTYVGEEEIGGGVRTWHLEVKPKSAESYRSTDLWVDSDGMPRQVKINELNGDTLTGLLSNIVKNSTLNARMFNPQYPSTVKRIRG